MERIPAVDILDGRCVQLVGGKPGTEKTYGDPVETSERWVKEGARMLHVVDLDATLGLGENTDTVIEIKNKANVPIQFGGGIRTVEKARELLQRGVDRIIVGTLAVEDCTQNTGKLGEIAKAGGRNRIVAAVDSSRGLVVYSGWRERTAIKTTDLVNQLEDRVWGFLYTNVDVEGRMMGVNMKAIKEVVDSTKKPVMISGGISSEEDIKDIEEAGAWGVVLGKALYEGKIKLR